MKIITLIVILLAIAFPVLSFADEGSTVGRDLSKPPEGLIKDGQGVLNAISAITDWIFGLFLVIAVLFVLWGAYNILIAKGDPEKFVQARSMIVYAVIAVMIAVLSKSIIVIAAKIAGADITL